MTSRSRTRRVMLAMSVLASALAVAGPARAVDQGSVVGTVTSSDQRSVSGVRVHLRTTAGLDTGQSQLVGADGTYAIAAAPGTYVVYFSPGLTGLVPEYFDDAAAVADATSVVVTSGGVAHADAQLAPVDVGPPAGTARISGRVTDPSGRPIAATVSARSIDDGFAASATADPGTGAYSLTALPAGTFEVEFSADGYTRERWNDAHRDDPSTVVTVAAGAATTGVDAVLDPQGALTGRVTVPAGFSPQQVYVTVRQNVADPGRPIEWGFVDQTFAGAGGSYGFTGLDAGTFAVCFEFIGVQFRCHAAAPALGSATPIPVAAGTTASGVDTAFGHLAPSIRIKAKAGKRRVTVAVSIAPSAGTEHGRPIAATGVVKVKIGARVVRARLNGGKAGVVVKRIGTGKKTVHVSFGGDRLFSTAKRTVKVRVR